MQVQKKKKVYIHIFVTSACKISISGTKKLCVSVRSAKQLHTSDKL